jgi:nitroreductase
MNLTEMIYRRKSVRSYTNEPVSDEILQKIEDFVAGAKPLYPEIKVKMEIVPRNQVKCICPWTTPRLVTIFSEEKPGYLENAGFIFQQLDLYLQSIGIGACWLGMGTLTADDVFEKQRKDGLKYVMMMAFGYPKGKALRNGKEDFKRKSLAEIADVQDERLEPARLAPSSVNSQPWYFVHEEDKIHAYCAHKGLLSKKLGNTNQIDMGIALAHMYLTNKETFDYEKLENVKELKDHTYIGSFCI